MNGFLERLPKLTSEEIKNLTIPMCIKEMEFVVKILPTKKTGLDGFHNESYQRFNRKI